MLHRTILEALLFSAVSPLSIDELSELMEIDENEVKLALQDYATWLIENNSGMRLIYLGSKYQLQSSPACFYFVEKIREKEDKLSPASLETLSVIAFKQPITKSEIEEIRGVNCDNIIRQLLHKDLIRILGRKATIGKPMLYGTTDSFLHSVGLSSLEELKEECKNIKGE